MGESLFPSSNDNALSVSQGRTEGHRWVKDAIPIKHIGLVMNGPLYWETLQNGLASCKHDQNRSMSVGSRKAVRCGLGFNVFNIKVLAYCGAEPRALKNLEKCEKSG